MGGSAQNTEIIVFKRDMESPAFEVEGFTKHGLPGSKFPLLPSP